MMELREARMEPTRVVPSESVPNHEASSRGGSVAAMNGLLREPGGGDKWWGLPRRAFRLLGFLNAGDPEGVVGGRGGDGERESRHGCLVGGVGQPLRAPLVEGKLPHVLKEPGKGRGGDFFALGGRADGRGHHTARACPRAQ